MWYSGTASGQDDRGAWFEPPLKPNVVQLLLILRKNGIVCVLVVHHSLDFMRTNNKKGYKYTNFRRVIQQCDTVWYSGIATAQDVRGGWFEPGSNLGKEDQLL